MPFISQEVEDIPERKLSPRHTCTPRDISKGGSSFLVLPLECVRCYGPVCLGKILRDEHFLHIYFIYYEAMPRHLLQVLPISLSIADLFRPRTLSLPRFRAI